MELNITHPHVVWYKDLHDLMDEVYGKNTDIQQTYELYNDSYLEFAVEKDGPDNVPWPYIEKGEDWSIEAGLELIEQWKNDEIPDLSTDMILWHLAYIGKIPEGNYLVTVWW